MKELSRMYLPSTFFTQMYQFFTQDFPKEVIEKLKVEVHNKHKNLSMITYIHQISNKQHPKYLWKIQKRNERRKQEGTKKYLSSISKKRDFAIE